MASQPLHHRLKHHWYRLPAHIRKPVVLVVGLLFIVAAVLTGWLPGPGGIPLFLIGIAILATEFAWAARVRDYVLIKLKQAGRLYRHNPVLGTLFIVLAIAVIGVLGFSIYQQIHN
jgi:uncharacterized protein (TIGR02611 family)